MNLHIQYNEKFNRLILLYETRFISKKKTYRELHIIDEMDARGIVWWAFDQLSLVVITIIAPFSLLLLLYGKEKKMTGDRQIQIYLLLAL
jgi:hypothetical protein